MNVLYLWAMAYAPQVFGFILSAIGMQFLLIADASRVSSYIGLIVLILGAGWLSAVFGAELPWFRKPKHDLLPPDPFDVQAPWRVYWLGLIVFTLGCAIPLSVNLAQNGWTSRNQLRRRARVAGNRVRRAEGPVGRAQASHRG